MWKVHKKNGPIPKVVSGDNKPEVYLTSALGAAVISVGDAPIWVPDAQNSIFVVVTVVVDVGRG